MYIASWAPQEGLRGPSGVHPSWEDLPRVILAPRKSLEGYPIPLLGSSGRGSPRESPRASLGTPLGPPREGFGRKVFLRNPLGISLVGASLGRSLGPPREAFGREDLP